MFSGLVSSVRSSMKSPKALLASYLVSSLETFFIVDPDAIELNLLSNNKIVLHHVQLKPQRSCGQILQGEVDKIEFSWIWGGDGATSFIRETKLTIHGACFRLVIVPEEKAETAVSKTKVTVALSEPNKTPDNGYIQQCIQQIIDHLALNIIDFSITIETGLEKLIFEAKSLKLVSLGYSPNEFSEATTLSQRISFESFCAYLIEPSGKKVESSSRLPLMDPFDYAASIRRTSGRRFFDGLAFGLEVVGELASEMEEPIVNGITIHAGAAQIHAVTRLLEVLLESSQGALTPCIENEESYTFTKEQNVFGDKNVVETKHQSTSTSFVLPFPCVNVCLPNKLKVRTPSFTLHYCMDGTMCRVEGREGIMINDCINFLRLEDDARWLVDFTKSRFLLEKSLATVDREETEKWEDAAEKFEEADLASMAILATVHWVESEMKQLLQEVCEIMGSSSMNAFNRVDLFNKKNSSTSNPSIWSISVAGTLSARIEGDSRTDYIEGFLLSPFFLLSHEGSEYKYMFKEIKMEGATIRSSSFGDIRVSVPPLAMAMDREKICLKGCVEAAMQSTAAIGDAQQFLLRALSLDTMYPKSAPSRERMEFPFTICVPAVTIDVSKPKMHVTLNEIKLNNSRVCCSCLRYADEGGTAACISGVEASFLHDIRAKLLQIESLHIPGILELTKPIDNTTLSLVKGVLQIDMSCVEVIIKDKEEYKPIQQTYTASNTASLFFPVRLRLPELRLKTQYNVGCTITIQQIDVAVSPMNESIVIDNTGDVAVRVEASGDEWLDSSVASLSMILSPSYKGFSLSSITCANVHVGPSAFGHISVDIPSVRMSLGQEELCVGGAVTVSLSSTEVAGQIQSLLTRLLEQDSSSSSFPLTLIVPSLTVHILDVGAHFTVDTIKASGTELLFASMSIVQSNGITAFLSGISFFFGEVVTAEMEWIESLFIPSVGALGKPVGHTRLAFDGESLQIYMPSTHVLLTNVICERKINASKGAASVPFLIQLNISDLSVSNSMDCEQIRCHQINLDAKPILADPFGGQPGTMVEVGVYEVKSKMMQVDAARASAVIYGDNFTALYNFTFSAAKAVVVAGFSSIDWSNMLVDDTRLQTKLVMLLPFARIKTFTVHLSYAGYVIATHDSVCIPDFQGGPSTTLNDVIGHVTNAVLCKAPSIISNTAVCGENVVEMTAKSAGRMAASVSLQGAAAGSIAGLVAVDSVRGAIARGKESRNASTNDAYQFGDFTRGSIRSVKQAVTNPEGASSTVGKYVKENKSRLGGAGGSGVGMVIGTTIAGPLGFVVGSYLGSQAGQKVFTDAPLSQEEFLVQAGARDLNDEQGTRNREATKGMAGFDKQDEHASDDPVTRHHRGVQDAQQGYRFGDLTRSVISKGKKKDGRSEKDGYKFGDFTRGLFG